MLQNKNDLPAILGWTNPVNSEPFYFVQKVLHSASTAYVVLRPLACGQTISVDGLGYICGSCFPPSRPLFRCMYCTVFSMKTHATIEGVALVGHFFPRTKQRLLNPRIVGRPIFFPGVCNAFFCLPHSWSLQPGFALSVYAKSSFGWSYPTSRAPQVRSPTEKKWRVHLYRTYVACMWCWSGSWTVVSRKSREPSADVFASGALPRSDIHHSWKNNKPFCQRKMNAQPRRTIP